MKHHETSIHLLTTTSLKQVQCESKQKAKLSLG